eukprot:894575-Alexandrium_andersonii.AAC.1
MTRSTWRRGRAGSARWRRSWARIRARPSRRRGRLGPTLSETPRSAWGPRGAGSRRRRAGGASWRAGAPPPR